MNFSTLPLDILIDSILPALDSQSLARLSRTSSSFRSLVTHAENVWKLLILRDFHVAIVDGRRSQFMKLYSKMKDTKAYVWGQSSNGRLGSDVNYSTINGGVTTPMSLPLKGVLAIIAGGWSFLALTESGVWGWGTMDGETFAPRNFGLSHPGVVQRTPLQLSQLEGMVQISGGRKHYVARSEKEVMEMRSFGKIYSLKDEQWQGNYLQVDAGWSHSSLLTSTGHIFVWWEIHENLIIERNGNYYVTFESTRLPPLPKSDPSLSNPKVIKIASGDNFILALSEIGMLYYLDISKVPEQGRLTANGPFSEAEINKLQNAFLSGTRAWILLEHFCNVGAQITHVSASYRSFTAYSVPLNDNLQDSIVLMSPVDLGIVTSQTRSRMIPELQGMNVIQIVQGDYIIGALTASGRLFTFGQYCSGALGLGHPSLPNTPLSSKTNSVAPLSVDTPTMVRFGKESAAEAHNEIGIERTTGKFVWSVTSSGWHMGALAIELGDEQVVEEAAPPKSHEQQPQLAQAPGLFSDRIFRFGYAARGGMGN